MKHTNNVILKITLQKSVGLQQNDVNPTMKGVVRIVFSCYLYFNKVKTLTTNTGSKEIQLYLNRKQQNIYLKQNKMHRKCLKSTKTTEQACRPLHISYSLISLIQKVINDCSVALVEGVIDGGMVRVLKQRKRWRD